MAKEIFMPKLSSTMTEGTLLEWFKEEGEEVETGDPVFEIMTDKINIEVEAYEDGILLKKYYKSDDIIPVNQVVGYIGETGEKVPDTPPLIDDSEGEAAGEAEESDETPRTSASEESGEKEELETSGSPDKVRATPAARAAAREKEIDITTIKGSGPKGRIHAADVTAVPQTAATPLAKRIADDHDVNLQEVKGSGVHQKINKQDVLNVVSSSTEEAQTTEKLKGVRKITAERMSESASAIPHVTMNFSVNMTKIADMKKTLGPTIEEKTGRRLSFNDLFIFITAKALKRHPELNVTFDGETITYHEAVHMGTAVAIDEKLFVPVLPNAEASSLTEVKNNSATLIEKSRSQSLAVEEMQGGTFTISNLGMYAIDSFNPIINQPQGAILGISAIEDKPVVVNGEITVQPVTTCSLSFDHRIINGAPAAAFCTTLKQLIEEPYELFV
ncbi:dihydrolipoamide acetyltransferase family protein [Alkalicoccus saliphilus]|uniref:Dihydrolipoamide acetyltransferase component of pyruvate dehydrogenase complex n=1 Tax=Alkalicoccus saliphilus TaxID=200989 RepID=A0A2T4U2C8_9BACI|nr:dihydrolipoamide acetyltransferase family protein [Alkalicoccus saliphilus]PTL37515.1 branched-chain alpha-keto acid dehydrogenase subunit E2 [Alkalicoccus saliphilus]